MTTNLLDLWLGGRLAGQLMRADDGQVEFLYDDAYRRDRSTTPVSVSIPKTTVGHAPDRVMPWLSNLVPDAVEVRDRWAAKFGERRNDPFTLLSHMGQDAPGAVQFAQEGIAPSDEGMLSPLSERRIAERINAIIADPDHWVDDGDEDNSRFSLGGNQGKFALALVDGAWQEPNGRAASTHIIKPGMVTASGRAGSVRTNEKVQAVEFVTMRAARGLGIPTASVDIREFDGVPAFITTRYDRIHDHDAAETDTVRRIHQEDFLQALGVLPSRKYEQDGGPSMADMMRLLRDVSSPSTLRRDLDVMGSLFAFNLLVAGVDAHSKNHSFLLSGDQVRLAPAYDLISAHGIWDESRVKFTSAAAVKYGKYRRYRSISGRDLVRTADVIGISRTAFAERLRAMAHELPEAIEGAVVELPAALRSEEVKRMPERVGVFARALAARTTAEDIADTPRWTPPVVHAISSVRGRLWVPGRWSGGSWVSGHYRDRPRVRSSSRT